MKKIMGLYFFLILVLGSGTTMVIAQENTNNLFKELGFSTTSKRTEMPVVKFKTLDGKDVLLSDYKGKVVVLNFWATWCPPCKAEMPSFQKFYESLKQTNIIFLAVSIGENPTTVTNFLKNNPSYQFPIFTDQSGTNGQLARAIPTTYVIDKQGLLIAKVTGSRDWSIKEILNALLEADKE